MKKQIINIISAAFILAMVAGCKKGYLDINNNPNSATNTTPELVLPQALATTAAQESAVGTATNLFASCWLGYWAPSGSYSVSSTDPASYYQSTGFGDGTWQAFYHNLEDYTYIEQAGKAENKPFYEGAAKIMKAIVFQQLVDMFNNVPYSQAFLGTANITPKYDNADSVYMAITSQLDSGVILMQNPLALATGSSISVSDVMFGGNTTSWIQFANTLELRILMRQSQVISQSYLNSELANITKNGQGFLTADASVNPHYLNSSTASGNQQSPFYGFFVTTTGLRTTGGSSDYYRGQQYMITYLVKHNDTFRLKRIFSPGGTDLIPGGSNDATIYPASAYVGNVLGQGTLGLGGSGASSVGEGLLRSPGQPSILISAAESYFLQAEAALRGWTGFTGAAANFYNGVLASFTYLESNNPNGNNAANEATALTSQADLTTNYNACSTDAQRLACIIRQKWIAMDGISPFEAWCDYRRTGQPSDIPVSLSPYIDKPPTMPIRILYPLSEYNVNTANVDAQGTINAHTSPVFWNH